MAMSPNQSLAMSRIALAPEHPKRAESTGPWRAFPSKALGVSQAVATA
jgi:hypothetical protein